MVSNAALRSSRTRMLRVPVSKERRRSLVTMIYYAWKNSSSQVLPSQLEYSVKTEYDTDILFN